MRVRIIGWVELLSVAGTKRYASCWCTVDTRSAGDKNSSYVGTTPSATGGSMHKADIAE
jgi:hypothetical protein